MKTTVLNTRHYEAGYDIRTEEVELEGCNKHIEKRAYTPEGLYIGKSKLAYQLCVKMGIKPEMISDEWCSCAVGFSEQDQKWYGWSRFMYGWSRFIHGFGIGDKVTKESCGYTPSDVNELADAYRRWNDLVEIVDDNTIRVSVKMCNTVGENADGSLVLEDADEMDSYKVETGRGEWTAKTLDDARQMACDFAEDLA